MLRPLAAASAVLALGSATPAFGASSSPANAAPDPSPGASSPAPDPYPGIKTRPVVVTRPVATSPFVPPVTRRTAPPVHHAVHRVRIRHHVTTHVSPPPARLRRPEPPAPSLGHRIFGAVSNAPRVPTGAALAVALLVLLSGLFLARVAREAAR
ncbi:MAG TPA: hypothetical protein VGH82_04935 [Gaiellaceae bacterium]